MEICEEQGKIYNKMTKKLINQNSYVCLKGKQNETLTTASATRKIIN